MRTWLPLVVLVAGLLAPRPGSACELDKTLEVVGFDTKDEQVLIRAESALTLDLLTVELATGKQTGAYAILEYNDDDSARQVLRGRRWKQAEADLTKRGFRILPDYPAARGNRLSLPGGVTLGLEDFRSDSNESHREGSSLVATRAGKRIVLLTVSSPTANDANYLKSLYLDPGRRFVVAVSFGCTPKTYVFEVSEVARKLDAAK